MPRKQWTQEDASKWARKRYQKAAKKRRHLHALLGSLEYLTYVRRGASAGKKAGA